MSCIFREPDIALEYEYQPGVAPVVVFFPGYGSDMHGTKALALLDWCRRRGQAILRFDYAGHGASGGDFLEGTIGSWRADAAFIIQEVVPAQKLLLVGSSMGGWIALLLGETLAANLTGMVLIAPAVDFTESLIAPSLSDSQRAELQEKGVLYQPSEYGKPMPLTLTLMQEARAHLLLDEVIPISAPIHILHGMRDDSVPWQQSMKLSAALASPAVGMSFIKDGDHRLSRPQDLRLLAALLGALLGDGGA